MMSPTLDRTVDGVREHVFHWRREGQRIALVPTMGALHAGHLALVETARSKADRVIVSIFVNPSQFGPGEDFSTYPRDFDGDVAKLSHLVDAVFAPVAEEMYPPGHATVVAVAGPALGLESDSRPHFFAGVATIVSKLLLAVGPDIAVFGEKDYQQLLVTRRMVADLHLPVEIVGTPIVRDHDGLALSSRNAYLDPDQRAIAPKLHETLNATAGMLRAGTLTATAMEQGRAALAEAGFDVDYFELRDANTLGEIANRETDPMRLLVAARLGRTRLIDNVAV